MSFALNILILVCLSLYSVGVFAESSKEHPDGWVDYFTDNGWGNAVGPPAGVYHKGITYIAYQGPKEDAWVASYNHKTAEWSGPFLAGVSALGKDAKHKKIDNHGKPTLAIDNTGYLHIVYGGHGGTPQLGKNTLGNYNSGEQRHIVSRKPFDIADWQRLENISPFGTYSQLITMDNGDLYLFYRHGAHRSHWVYQLSTDNGRTFTAPVPIALTQRRTDQPAVDSWYFDFIKISSNKIAARFYYHICKDAPHHDGERQNSYYMVLDTDAKHWRDVQGRLLEVPVTKAYADQNALVMNTGKLWVHGGPMAMDANGYPHLVMYMGANEKKHPQGGPKDIYHFHWDGKAWQMNNHHQKLPQKRGQLSIPAPEKIELLLSEGSKINRWQSDNGGKNFLPAGNYFQTTGKQGNLLTSAFIENAHPDARFLVAKKVTGTQFRRIYLVGDSGPVKRKQADASLLAAD